MALLAEPASRPATRLVPSPLGPITIAAIDAGIVLCEFDNNPRVEREMAEVEAAHGPCDRRPSPGVAACLDQLEDELARYFAGGLREFRVPLAPFGTPFERRVWGELLRIPYGQTRSYADVARSVGAPAATRAVGRANGRNRIAIVVPCHRVIASDGTLHGYGGGLPRKRRLLTLEGALGPDLFDHGGR